MERFVIERNDILLALQAESRSGAPFHAVAMTAAVASPALPEAARIHIRPRFLDAVSRSWTDVVVATG